MRSRAVVLLLVLAALLGLQQGIRWLNGNVGIRQQQAIIIKAQDIDPAALFYTESALALSAARTVRSSISKQQAPD